MEETELKDGFGPVRYDCATAEPESDKSCVWLRGMVCTGIKSVSAQMYKAVSSRCKVVEMVSRMTEAFKMRGSTGIQRALA